MSLPRSLNVIPRPAQFEHCPGNFTLSAATPLLARGEAAVLAAQALNARLEALHGLKLPLLESTDLPCIELVHDDSLPPEAYHLSVTPQGVRASGGAAGLYYAAQTLAQLLQGGQLPAAEIQDSPRFGWRGLMLDVGRHFFPVEVVKTLIDTLALFKINTFHWHLSDDQGWRAEIKKYPRLTQVGAWREQTLVGHHNAQPWQYDGVPHGGFYTQEQMREVVQYAHDRHMQVVPEIDMPGHMQAAIAAYPELGNTPSTGVRQVWAISEQVLNVREETITFMQDVLSELLGIFPSEFIHVGGDECPKEEWKASAEMQALKVKLGLHSEDELQSYFMGRMDEFLTARGRRMIGWDEILEGGLAPGATVMSWRGIQGGIEAAHAGHDVVMTPYTDVYLDYYQARDQASEPLAIGEFLPWQKVYAYEPIPAELNDQQARHVLGVQANTWTEYIPNAEHLQYMIFPRALALAEIAWSSKETRSEADFRTRLPGALKMLKTLGVNFRALDDVEV